MEVARRIFLFAFGFMIFREGRDAVLSPVWMVMSAVIKLLFCRVRLFYFNSAFAYIY